MRPAITHLDIAAQLRPYFEEGQSAALAGQPVDACRFQRQDRRSAWETGWHAATRAMEKIDPPTPEEQARARPHLAALKEALTAGSHPGPFWSVQYRTDAVQHLWLPSGLSACGPYGWPSFRLRIPVPSLREPAGRCPRCEAAHG